MISCEKSSFLTEKKLAKDISFSEKSQLFIHTLICKACRNYEKQSKTLDAFLSSKLSLTNAKKEASSIDINTLNKIKNLIFNKIK
jgi:hypothetical protein